MTDRRLSLLLIVLCAARGGPSFAEDAPAAAHQFEAGFARRDVTPKEPVPMWGYGGRHAARSQGTLDPLHADALVVRAGGAKLAIIGLDLGRPPSERSLEVIRRRIKEETGVGHAFIAGSHTHHGPVLELSDEPGKGRGKYAAALRYYRELEDAVVAAVAEADRNAVPATFAAGSARLEGFNRNRHSRRRPETDPTLAVLRFDGPGGKPLAVLVNFAAHPTMVEAAGLRFSADFAGPLKRTVEKEVGAPALFMQGAAGDLSAAQVPGRRGHGAYGEALGREAAKLAAGLEPAAVKNPSIQFSERRFDFAARTDLNNPAVRLAYGLAFFPELVVNYFDEYAGNRVRPRLTVALLNGEIALVGGSGEFFSAHANRLRDRARVKSLLFFGYCNGYHQYFPTIEAAAEGGYGADALVAPAEVGAGERMTDAALIEIYRMKGRL